MTRFLRFGILAGLGGSIAMTRRGWFVVLAAIAQGKAPWRKTNITETHLYTVNSSVSTQDIVRNAVPASKLWVWE